MFAVKKLLLALLALSFPSAATNGALVAHYTFEGDADDLSSHGLDARLVGTASMVTDAERGQVLELDGFAGYVDCGDDSSFDIADAITVAAWVKIDTVRAPWAAVVAKGDSAWRLSTFEDQRRFHFAVTGAPLWHAADGTTQAAFGQWHHVCGTYDGTEICLYVNGVPDASAAYDGPISTNNFSVLIGENAEATGRKWDGLVDDVRIYDHALTAPEVTHLVAGRQIEPGWGRLANPGFEGHHIRATLFFPGQAKDGSRPYECTAPPNLFLFTVHPSDTRHLNWSRSAANRAFAIDQMIEAGLNVIAMSSWGEDFLPCNTGWAPWAPMQCSPRAHDELFDATVGKRALIVPFIESRADWAFRDEFPTFDDAVAPGTVSQIVNLIGRYLQNPRHPKWAEKWAQVYDNSGQARYAVTLIHASSNRLFIGQQAAFAEGFDLVAQEVFEATRVKVGFLLDVLPPGTFAPGHFKPSWQWTGPHLKEQASILGIMCFIPEIWLGSSNETRLLNWKRDFSSGWASTGIPFLMDVSPGYDAHLVFPNSVRYGLNPTWTAALTEMVRDYGQDGFVYNSWNGYTEGMAAMELRERSHGNVYRAWLGTLTAMYPADEGSQATEPNDPGPRRRPLPNR